MHSVVFHVSQKKRSFRLHENIDEFHTRSSIPKACLAFRYFRHICGWQQTTKYGCQNC